MFLQLSKRENYYINRYKDKHRNNKEPRDEIEKSIIANTADDVIVSVKGRDVTITFKKNF